MIKTIVRGFGRAFFYASAGECRDESPARRRGVAVRRRFARIISLNLKKEKNRPFTLNTAHTSNNKTVASETSLLRENSSELSRRLFSGAFSQRRYYCPRENRIAEQLRARK